MRLELNQIEVNVQFIIYMIIHVSQIGGGKVLVVLASETRDRVVNVDVNRQELPAHNVLVRLLVKINTVAI